MEELLAQTCKASCPVRELPVNSTAVGKSQALRRSQQGEDEIPLVVCSRGGSQRISCLGTSNWRCSRSGLLRFWSSWPRQDSKVSPQCSHLGSACLWIRGGAKFDTSHVSPREAHVNGAWSPSQQANSKPLIRVERVDRQMVKSTALGHARRACIARRRGAAGWRLSQQRRGSGCGIRVKIPGSNPMELQPTIGITRRWPKRFWSLGQRSKRSRAVDSNWSQRSWWSFNGPNVREGWKQPADAPCQTSINSTEHYVCECVPGYAEVVTGGTPKTCHNNWSVLQGCQRVVFSGAVTGHVSLAQSQRRGAYSCACSGGFVSVAENDNPLGRIGMCGVAPIVNRASRRTRVAVIVNHASWTCNREVAQSRMAGWMHPLSGPFDVKPVVPSAQDLGAIQ